MSEEKCQWGQRSEVRGLEGAVSRGTQVASRSWKNKGMNFSEKPPEECKPANTLTFELGNPLQTADLQNCEVIHPCCPGPLGWGNVLQQR